MLIRAAPALLQKSLLRFQQIGTRRCLVWKRPTEIDFRIHDLTVTNGQDLGIAKAPSVRMASFVSDKDLIAVGDQVDKVEAHDVFAVGPAPSEIGCAVDLVVEWTGKVKVIGD